MTGVNERVIVRERVVLPRATDWVADALELIVEAGVPEVECFVLDLKAHEEAL